MAYGYIAYGYVSGYVVNCNRYDDTGNDWTAMTSAPVAARGTGGGSVTTGEITPDNNISVGGTGATSSTVTYSRNTNQWSAKSNVPTPRENLKGSFVEDYVYMPFGAGPLTSQERWLQATDVWSAKTAAGTAYFDRNVSSAYALGYQYCFLGNSGAADENNTERYSASGDVWCNKEDAPVIGSAGDAWAHADDLYSYYYSATSADNTYKGNYRYQYSTNIHSGRSAMTGSHQEGSAYPLGEYGYVQGFTGSVVCERHLGSANTWTPRQDMPGAYRRMVGAGAGGPDIPLNITEAHMLDNTEGAGDPLADAGDVKITYNISI